MPGEQFADNYWQLVALRGVMEYASIRAAGGIAPILTLSALLFFKRTWAARKTEDLHVE